MNFLRLLLCAPSNLKFLLHDSRLGLRSQFLDFLLMRSCIVMMFFVVFLMMLVTFDRIKRLFKKSGQEIGVGNFVAAEKLLILQMSILWSLRFLLMHRLINWLVSSVALPQVRRKWFLHIIPVSKDLILQFINVLLIVMSLNVVWPRLVLNKKKWNNQFSYRFLRQKQSVQFNASMCGWLHSSCNLSNVSKSKFKLSLNLAFITSSKLELETLINKMFIDQLDLKKISILLCQTLWTWTISNEQCSKPNKGLKGLRMFTFWP